MTYSYEGQVELAAVLPQLADYPAVQQALAAAYPENASRLLDAARKGDPDDELDTSIIDDLIHSDYEVALELQGHGSYGEFSINVCRFGPVYWVFAPDFDNVEYFTSLEAAREAAEDVYESFIVPDEEDDDTEDP